MFPVELNSKDVEILRDIKHHVYELKFDMKENQNQPEWEVDDDVELFTGVLGVREAFQVDDEDLRKRPQIQLLSGELVPLTRWAVPKNNRCTKFTALPK